VRPDYLSDWVSKERAEIEEVRTERMKAPRAQKESKVWFKHDRCEKQVRDIRTENGQPGQ